MSRRADAILKVLESQIDALNGDAYPRPVKLEIANCLSMCGAGPNVVIYPTPVVLNDVKPEQVNAIISEFIRPLMIPSQPE
jgi:(2Fe-2S) ferredoxin